MLARLGGGWGPRWGVAVAALDSRACQRPSLTVAFKQALERLRPPPGSTRSRSSCELRDVSGQGLPGTRAERTCRCDGPGRRCLVANCAAQDEQLREAVDKHGARNWKAIAKHLEDRTDVQCLHRWQKVLRPGLVKGPWTDEEDKLVIALVARLGTKKWSLIAQCLNGRLGKQCRERWYNHLDPSINKGPFTVEEDIQLLTTKIRDGTKWASIAAQMPGRTDNMLKNRYNSTLRRIMKGVISAMEKGGEVAPTDSDKAKESAALDRMIETGMLGDATSRRPKRAASGRDGGESPASSVRPGHASPALAPQHAAGAPASTGGKRTSSRAAARAAAAVVAAAAHDRGYRYGDDGYDDEEGDDDDDDDDNNPAGGAATGASGRHAHSRRQGVRRSGRSPGSASRSGMSDGYGARSGGAGGGPRGGGGAGGADEYDAPGSVPRSRRGAKQRNGTSTTSPDQAAVDAAASLTNLLASVGGHASPASMLPGVLGFSPASTHRGGFGGRGLGTGLVAPPSAGRSMLRSSFGGQPPAAAAPSPTAMVGRTPGSLAPSRPAHRLSHQHHLRQGGPFGGESAPQSPAMLRMGARVPPSSAGLPAALASPLGMGIAGLPSTHAGGAGTSTAAAAAAAAAAAVAVEPASL
ncbi:MYB3R3 [Symbiodinium sp. KB8]|nr:MYB3R3 [Symbiodinium sp. KB8]